MDRRLEKALEYLAALRDLEEQIASPMTTLEETRDRFLFELKLKKASGDADLEELEKTLALANALVEFERSGELDFPPELKAQIRLNQRMVKRAALNDAARGDPLAKAL